MTDQQTPQIRHSPRRPEEVPEALSELPPISKSFSAAIATTGIEPTRSRGEGASEALHRDGAVVLPDLPTDDGSLTVAAAEVWGERLRRLFPVRHRGSDGEGALTAHTDTFQVVHDVHGDLRHDRHPDEDILVMQLVHAPAAGGGSKIVDAYRLIDLLQQHDPQLHEFLTTEEVDLLAAWQGLAGVPAATRVGLLVEFTRRGRRAIRLGGGIKPLLRSSDHSQQIQLLARFQQVANHAASLAPAIVLSAGDVLAIDNYRCLHGRDAFTGPRHLTVKTGMSTEAF